MPQPTPCKRLFICYLCIEHLSLPHSSPHRLRHSLSHSPPHRSLRHSPQSKVGDATCMRWSSPKGDSKYGGRLDCKPAEKEGAKLCPQSKSVHSTPSIPVYSVTTRICMIPANHHQHCKATSAAGLPKPVSKKCDHTPSYRQIFHTFPMQSHSGILCERLDAGSILSHPIAIC